MPSLWFVCPAHGRAKLARICLTQLRRTCDQLTAEGVEASAVVVADDENLDTAMELGFTTYRQDNEFVSRKFNDGIQVALDPEFNSRPADYVVPIGSDDFVDWRLFTEPLPDDRTVVGFQRMAFVREDGREIIVRQLKNVGGAGIRIYPRALMAPLGYRPADEDRYRACDTSILTNLREHWGDALRVQHMHLHDHQIVDWKTSEEQLNPYETLRRHHQVSTGDPFADLENVYPAAALWAMQNHYAGALVA